MKLLVLSDLHIEFLPDGYRLPAIDAAFDAVVITARMTIWPHADPR